MKTNEQYDKVKKLVEIGYIKTVKEILKFTTDENQKQEFTNVFFEIHDREVERITKEIIFSEDMNYIIDNKINVKAFLYSSPLMTLSQNFSDKKNYKESKTFNDELEEITKKTKTIEKNSHNAIIELLDSKSALLSKRASKSFVYLICKAMKSGSDRFNVTILELIEAYGMQDNRKTRGLLKKDLELLTKLHFDIKSNGNNQLLSLHGSFMDFAQDRREKYIEIKMGLWYDKLIKEMKKKKTMKKNLLYMSDTTFLKSDKAFKLSLKIKELEFLNRGRNFKLNIKSIFEASGKDITNNRKLKELNIELIEMLEEIKEIGELDYKVPKYSNLREFKENCVEFKKIIKKS